MSSAPQVKGRPLTWANDCAGTLYFALRTGSVPVLVATMLGKAMMLDVQAFIGTLRTEHPEEWAIVAAEIDRLHGQGGGPS